jgi:hypothetical protein
MSSLASLGAYLHIPLLRQWVVKWEDFLFLLTKAMSTRLRTAVYKGKSQMVTSFQEREMARTNYRRLFSTQITGEITF